MTKKTMFLTLCIFSLSIFSISKGLKFEEIKKISHKNVNHLTWNYDGSILAAHVSKENNSKIKHIEFYFFEKKVFTRKVTFDTSFDYFTWDPQYADLIYILNGNNILTLDARRQQIIENKKYCLPEKNLKPLGLCFNTDNDFVALFTNDQRTKYIVWNLTEGEKDFTVPENLIKNSNYFNFKKNDLYTLACAGRNGKLIIYDDKQMEEKKQYQYKTISQFPLSQLIWNNHVSSNVLAISDIQVSHKTIASTQKLYGKAEEKIPITQGNVYVVTDNQTLTFAYPKDIFKQPGTVLCLEWCPWNKNFLAIGYSTGHFVIWNLHNNEKCFFCANRDEYINLSINEITWSPNGKYLALTRGLSCELVVYKILTS